MSTKFVDVEPDMGRWVGPIPFRHDGEKIPDNFRGVCPYCITAGGRYTKVSDVAFWQGRYVNTDEVKINDPRIFPGKLYGVCRPHAHVYDIGHGFDTDSNGELFADYESVKVEIPNEESDEVCVA